MDQNIEPQVFHGNVAVHTHEMAPELYGDGSLEVQGRIYTDKLVPYTTSASVDINGVNVSSGVLVLKSPEVTLPTFANAGDNILYYDTTQRVLLSIDDQGRKTQVSGYRLLSKGDLLTNDGTKDTILSSTDVADGAVLSVDKTTTGGLRWTAIAGLADSEPETFRDDTWSNTNATVYVERCTFNVDVISAVFLLQVSFVWRMTGSNQLFYARIVIDNTDTLVEEVKYPSRSDIYEMDNSSVTEISNMVRLVSLNAGTHSITLQYSSATIDVTASIGNVQMCLTKVADLT